MINSVERKHFERKLFFFVVQKKELKKFSQQYNVTVIAFLTGLVCVCHTVPVCTLLIEHPSECEEGEDQQGEHDGQHLQLGQ